MSALDDLKDRIDAAIYSNDEQLITGDGLQTVLDDMVDTMGVSVSQNSQTGHTDITVGSTTTPVASVEDICTLYGATTYSDYIKNVFILPQTEAKYDYLKTQESGIRISYLGVRDTNLGGADSKFGLQLHISDQNVCSYWITDSPDLSKSLIYKLTHSSGSGEISTGFDVYVEFNPNIDLDTPSGLLSAMVWTKPLSAIQIALLYKLREFQNTSDYVNSQLPQIVNYLPTLKKYTDFIAFGSGLSDTVKNWLITNISEYYIIDSSYNTNRKYEAKYVTLNHSVLGGEDYLGFQIGTYDDGTLTHSYNYLIKADALSPNTLYKVQPQGDYPEFYIRTASAYSWLSSENLCAGPLFEFLPSAIGNGVQPFARSIGSAFANEAVITAENNIKRTFVVAQRGDLQPSELALFPDIYVCGNYDVPIGKILVITYIGFNNSNLGGENALGMQLGLKDISSQEFSQLTNFVLHNANSLEAGKLYSFNGKDGTELGGKVNLYFRTSEDFVWPSTDALRSCQLYITEYGGLGKNIQPFLREVNRGGTIITVGKDATKYNYTTLTDATNAAPNGAIILVYPGVYDNECITAGTTKTLYIIGIDRDKCVIKNNLGDYQYAVIHISSGLLRNLTIIQEATSTSNNGAYGVHADFNTGYNSTLRIENCHLQSNVPDTGGIGIGLRGGMHLTIKDCRLVSGTSGRALYLHDNDQDQFVGKQNFTLDNCIVESPNQAIIVQGQGKVGRDFSVQQFYIEFCRNIIKGTVNFTNWYSGETLGPISEDDFQGVKNLRLVDTSWGNNKSVFNNPELM